MITRSAVGAAATLLALSGCFGSNDDALPAAVTLDGVAGVTTIDTSAADVRDAWNIQIPIIQTGSDSTNIEFGTVCADEQQGVLIFVFDDLREMRFYRGTKTDAPVATPAGVKTFTTLPVDPRTREAAQAS